jgi:UDP-2-acetamido-2,6-beta-L-arabino-hexul-4-ose reductase
MKILITGSRGFLGRNLAVHLLERRDCETSFFDEGHSTEDLRSMASEADIIYHLAGVNRPREVSEFEKGNVGLTEQLCGILRTGGRAPRIVFSSSVQADLNNPYGVSKARAENTLRRFAAESGACVRIYRLKNIFGKWGRPNYNSVTATFCHNIANDLPISISDPKHKVELSYVDDVVAAFISEIGAGETGLEACTNMAAYQIELGDLAGRIQAFHEMRNTLTLPDFGDWFNRALYATYLSYVPEGDREQKLEIKSDVRGSLAEFIKQESFGQIFVSRTNPGVTRGNHYHDTKTEKFFVVEGEGLIRMRGVEGGPVKQYKVSGDDYQVIDIPPGLTHSITNVGRGQMVTLFWSSEMFDPNRPDTYYLPVDFEERSKTVLLEKA